LINLYSINENYIPLNIHSKKILRSDFLQINVYGANEQDSESLQPAEPSKHPKNAVVKK
jgi:hypothetical protein